MELFERDAHLTALETALGKSSDGLGQVALVSGEAGIGKTSLVEWFMQGHRRELPVLWGACDLLFSPRPLGPLYDMAPDFGEELPKLLESEAQRTKIFSAFLGELQRRPAILVFEDIHWADEATLDLLRYVGRRIRSTSALIVLTYRDDELPIQHPLRSLLGDLVASPAVKRIQLEPLSERAIRQMVGARDLDSAMLHQRTGGNPFFVSEILSSQSGGLPDTVRDAVLARCVRLSQPAEAVLQAAAIIGRRIETWLLTAVSDADVRAIEECITGGMLAAHGDDLVFRHALARETILATISPQRARALHRRVLDTLTGAQIPRKDLARLAHHAEASGDRQAVLEYAPAAARQASAASAHRAASDLYELALQYAPGLPPAKHAALLEAHAWECHLVNRRQRTIASRQAAIEIWRAAGDALKQGENLALLAMALLSNNQWAEAQETCREAIVLLEALPPGRQLALAYRMQALMHTFNHETGKALEMAEKALPLAERYGDSRVRAMAYDTLGSVLLITDYERGRGYLQRCLQVAQEAGLEARVATVYANLGSTSCDLYHFDRAERFLREGIAYAAERDLDLQHSYMLAWLALTYLHLGRLDEVAATAYRALDYARASANSRIPALLALGRLQARRGEPAAAERLNQALDLAQKSNNFQYIMAAHAALAEAAWNAGDLQALLREANRVFAAAMQKEHAWLGGELAFWRWRAGDSIELTNWMAKPFALQLEGRWQEAALEWERLNCPYEQARALAAGDAGAQLDALEIFERLGALPESQKLRMELQDAGVIELPPQPRASTRENPYGLTNRQMDVLALLIDGLSNAEIAARLHVSSKTVDHHVSAVLAKLDVHSRQAAAELARKHPHFR